MSEQLQLSETKKRLSPRVDAKVARMSKSKAAALDVPLEYVIERLLAGWVSGVFSLSEAPEELKNKGVQLRIEELGK